MYQVKAEVGSLFLVSLGENPIITFQHIVIQLVRKKTRLLHLSLTLCSDCDGTFRPITGHFREYVFPLAALCSTSWRQVTLLRADWLFKQETCTKIDLWRPDKLSCRQHCRLVWVKLRWTCLHRCNFPCNCPLLLCKLDLKERAQTNKIKCELGEKYGGESSLMLLLAWSPDAAYPSFEERKSTGENRWKL